MSEEQEPIWIRPTPEDGLRRVMIEFESFHDFRNAALAAIAYADHIGANSPEGALVLMQQAQVYATLGQAAATQALVDVVNWASQK